MSNDKYYDQILGYITEHGETGVNELAKAVNIPLSTMQRYLVGQTYFRKTINRKWDIPNNVDADIKSNTMTLMVDSVEVALKLLDSQIAEIHSSVKNALLPVNTLQRAVINLNTPVADKSANIDPRLVELSEKSQENTKIVKSKKSNIPEEYYDVLLNLDFVGLVLENGREYANSLLKDEIYLVLIGKSTEISEDTLEILEKYQKGA